MRRAYESVRYIHENVVMSENDIHDKELYQKCMDIISKKIGLSSGMLPEYYTYNGESWIDYENYADVPQMFVDLLEFSEETEDIILQSLIGINLGWAIECYCEMDADPVSAIKCLKNLDTENISRGIYDAFCTYMDIDGREREPEKIIFPEGEAEGDIYLLALKELEEYITTDRSMETFCHINYLIGGMDLFFGSLDDAELKRIIVPAIGYYLGDTNSGELKRGCFYKVESPEVRWAYWHVLEMPESDQDVKAFLWSVDALSYTDIRKHMPLSATMQGFMVSAEKDLLLCDLDAGGLYLSVPGFAFGVSLFCLYGEVLYDRYFREDDI